MPAWIAMRTALLFGNHTPPAVAAALPPALGVTPKARRWRYAYHSRRPFGAVLSLGAFIAMPLAECRRQDFRWFWVEFPAGSCIAIWEQSTSSNAIKLTMPALISELIVTLDTYARGLKSPGYYGYLGPEFAAWLKANNEKPHRTLMGRKTYELLNTLPEEARDDGWRKTTEQPGFLFSRTLERCDWPGLELVHDDMLGFVRRLKQDTDSELRVLGSLSVMRQLIEAAMLDTLRLMICPLILPKTGTEPIFNDLPDMGFQLASNTVLDGRVLVLDYKPAGAPPVAG